MPVTIIPPTRSYFRNARLTSELVARTTITSYRQVINKKVPDPGFGVVIKPSGGTGYIYAFTKSNDLLQSATVVSQDPDLQNPGNIRDWDDTTDASLSTPAAVGEYDIIEYDLGAVYEVVYIRYKFDYDHDYPYDRNRIYVSQDGSSWSRVVDCTQCEGTVKATNVRYVKWVDSHSSDTYGGIVYCYTIEVFTPTNTFRKVIVPDGNSGMLELTSSDTTDAVSEILEMDTWGSMDYWIYEFTEKTDVREYITADGRTIYELP